MKYVMLVPDGAADHPLKELGGKTPLQAADTPNIDFMAKNGLLGLVRTIPEGAGAGSDVASLSLLGYDPLKYYTGRGPLEAAYRGIRLGKGDVAFRCNLITAESGKLKDYSSGHITSEEAAVLIKAVDEALGTDEIHFYPGVSYRHLMIVKNDGSLKARCAPPHDVIGEPLNKNMPQGEGADSLRRLMEESRQILENHPINRKRIAERKNPANMIWLWGQGKAPQMPTFKERFNLTGAVISAVDVIKGIGHYAGLRILEVEGATGYFDTNYEGKAEKALEVLKEDDFVFVHVEATDEAGHEGNAKAKIKALEDFDKRLVNLVLQGLQGSDFRILVSPDHATPISVRTHVSEPVPFAVYSSSDRTDQARLSERSFDEISAGSASVYLNEGFKLIDLLIGG